MRVTAQLIDAATGHHLWGERYDRKLIDVFEVQDDLSGEIARAVHVYVAPRATRRPTASAEVYELLLRGREEAVQLKPDGIDRARVLFERALALDPACAPAHAGLAQCYLTYWNVLWTADPQHSLDPALGCAERAVALDGSLSDAHRAIALAQLWRRRHDAALAAARRSVELEPNNAASQLGLAAALSWDGELAAALPHAETAMRLNPHYPIAYVFYSDTFLSACGGWTRPSPCFSGGSRSSWTSCPITSLLPPISATSSREHLAAGGASTFMTVSRPSRRRPLSLHITALKSRAPDGAAPTAAIFVGDCEQTPALPAEMLGELYGLTPAEARVAREHRRGLRGEPQYGAQPAQAGLSQGRDLASGQACFPSALAPHARARGGGRTPVLSERALDRRGRSATWSVMPPHAA
ncbi:MAG: hypothetical protein FJX56_00965 [Alphaproteobacteria bacterium]|nr:hypothetical protein [Alphaproteobacteria bacterium]